MPTATDRTFTTFPFNATGGSTPRTMPARLGDFRNILDFGADPTGVADSAPAIRAAIAASGSTDMGCVFFPPGTYLVNSAINLESGNCSFILCGVGTLSKVVGNFADFIFRRVIDNPGGVGYVRVIENLYIQNTNTSSGSTINLVAGTSITSDGLTITITCNTPHGITVGDTRLISISGVGGADAATYNALWGVTATSATVLSAVYTNRILANGTGGSEAIMPGGAIAMNGSLRGTIQNCYIEGYYGIYATSDATISIYNIAARCTGGSRASGSIGIYFGGETAIRDCDVTFWDAGFRSNPATTTAFLIEGCRIEGNNYGAQILAGSGGVIQATSLESNQVDALYISGCGSLTVQSLAIIGSVASVNGIHIAGGVTRSTFANISITGAFSGSCFTVDSSNVSGTVLRGIDCSNNGSGTGVALGHLGLQVSGCNFSETYTCAQRPLAASGSPPIEGDVLMFSDAHATDAAWDGVMNATGTGAVKAVARYSATSNVWRTVAKWT